MQKRSSLQKRFDSILEKKWGTNTLRNFVLRECPQIVSPEIEVSSNNKNPLFLRGFALANYKKSLATKPSHFKTQGGLVLDAWQQRALHALLAGKHLIVDAPTSAGKTRVIEALLEEHLKENGRLVYTSPVKSLSNDKYCEFTEKYGREKVGINTGDFKENLGAPILLATLETYRNSLLGIEPDMRRRVVVYDEYHFLQDESRGSAWEESLILTPKGCQLILLSASVPNSEEFASWITELTGVETEVVRVTTRPVPLVDLIYTSYGWIMVDDLKLKQDDLRLFSETLKEQRRDERRLKGRSFYDQFVDPVLDALKLGLGPIIVYAGRRGDVEGIAISFARSLRQDYTGPEADKLRERVRTVQGFEYLPADLKRLIIRYGIAYHHSGMIPPGRVAVEGLLKEGLLRVCYGTMGISLGVNFAVKSAFIADESRPGEGGERNYSNTEIMQMLGRAGRRGHDLQGFSLWLNAGRYAEHRPKERERCQSSLKFDPTTVIGILGQCQDLSHLSRFYKKSFFLRGKNPKNVLLFDHELLLESLLHSGVKQIACQHITETYQKFKKTNNEYETPCSYCPGKKVCHKMAAEAKKSVLNRIVVHLQNVGALKQATPTELGHIARHFPQAGGLIISYWLAKGVICQETFHDYLQAMSAFGATHFKEIPTKFADVRFLEKLAIPNLIDTFYPENLFPELYDEVKTRRGEKEGSTVVFREFNLGAASIVKQWLNPKTTWDELVEAHSSRYFSAGDCMNVLFRFSTFLQSCARLREIKPDLALEAKRLQKILFREPLDARNRMLVQP